MTLFKKPQAKTASTRLLPLSAADVAAVSGGINPQPLPPGRRITL